MGLIETGVDKLMALVNEKERVLVRDVAKELGVSEKLIMDWSEFLEEEGFLKFEYKFSKVFLIKKDLSEETIKKKEKEYSSQKEAFVRKVQGMKHKISKDALALDEVKKEMDNIYKDINEKKDLIKKDLDILKKYEDSKDNFEKDMDQEKKKYGRMVKGVEDKVQSNYNKINELLKKIGGEEKKLVVKGEELEEMRKVEEQLKKYIQDSLDFLNKTMKKIDSTEKEITERRSTLGRLNTDAAKIEKELKKYDDKVVLPLLVEIRKKEKAIFDDQDKRFKELATLEKSLDQKAVDATAIEDKFISLLNSKMETVTIVENLSKEKRALFKELDELMKKIDALTIVTRGVSIADKIKKIKSVFTKIEEKEKKFQEDVDGLSNVIEKAGGVVPKPPRRVKNRKKK